MTQMLWIRPACGHISDGEITHWLAPSAMAVFHRHWHTHSVSQQLWIISTMILWVRPTQVSFNKHIHPLDSIWCIIAHNSFSINSNNNKVYNSINQQQMSIQDMMSRVYAAHRFLNIFWVVVSMYPLDFTYCLIKKKWM